ncbi:unnamed protein product [Euphydryas editha]|uniref:Uncharacterized protein n=1 Tax=Euphydryas editha TaxID=104508 RepID=A0AAU9VDA1_EUPED|nr:unnamed protein product [Euphydryas editha]
MWCRRGRPRLERTYSAIVASQRERAVMRATQRDIAPNQRYLRRLSTASSQLGDAPIRAQSYHQSGLAIVNETPDVSWVWKQQLPEKSDSCTSPRSISNSSLYELEQDLSKEELATFMYQVNCSIGAIT